MLEHIQKRVRTADDGALTAVFLATAPEAANIGGAFFLKSHAAGKQPLQIHWDRDTAGRLWAEGADLATLAQGLSRACSQFRLAYPCVGQTFIRLSEVVLKPRQRY